MRTCRTAALFTVTLATLAAMARGPLTAAEAPSTPAAEAPPACGCADELDSLVRKVEADYVGYHLLLPTLDRAAYERAKADLRARAAQATDDGCFDVLAELVDRFHDPHLFVSEQPKLSPGEVAQREATAESLPWTEASARAYLDRHRASLDPIEGIWNSEGARFAVERDSQAPGRRDFVAVLLTAGVENWKPGQVKAELTRRADGTYAVRYFYGDHSLHHLRGELFRQGALLRMAPVMWGKAYPQPPAGAGAIDPTNPRNPTLVTRPGGVVVIAMPSHDGAYGPRLEQLVSKSLDALQSAKLVVLDLRGNEGGGTQTSDVLAPFIWSPRLRPRPAYTGSEVVVSSPDQIAYFERLAGNMNPATPLGRRFAGIVDRMRREPGQVIATEVWGRQDPTEKPPMVYPAPAHFAILTDRGAVSAAEAFVLEAWVYDRVDTFGEPTGGSIDYQSVFMVPLDCKRHSYFLGYPTIGGSNDLPRGGFNATGIQPDVPIPATEPDPVGFIMAHYGIAAAG